MTNSQSMLPNFDMFRNGFVPKGAGKIGSYFFAEARRHFMKTIRNCILVFAAALAATVAAAQTVDLSGRIANSDGSPITNATILIYSAAPQQGTSSLCPCCYADCAKRGATGPDGKFEIKSLDPALVFRLLVLAPEHESKFIDKVNPAGGTVEVALKPLDAEATPPDLRIAGLVIGEDGQAVVGATLQIQGAALDNGSQSWGQTGLFAEQTAVSDTRGRFLIRCKSKVELIYAMAFARNAAPRPVRLRPGQDCLILMQEGVLVTGRVLAAGRPVAGAVVGVCPAAQALGEVFNSDRIATDGEGRFSSPNLPPDKSLILSGTMDSLRGKGALPSRQFMSGKNKTTTDLGDLALQPGFFVAGQILLADGKPVPERTRLLLAREGVSDHSELVLDADGRFEFQTVPAGSVSLSARLKGYKFSQRNPSLDWANGLILGKVDRDITNLTLVMEPGEFRFNSNPADLPEGADMQPRDKPLRSAKPF
jgi:hypothetical protein